MNKSAADDAIRPVRRLLIANRGEIAVRIIRTCRSMGISPIAVYSSADVNALHVQRADDAFAIGPPAALDSYLNGSEILKAARASGADAIHPGYGFLAENAEFARAVEEAGLVWIGPPPPVIALMGDKVASKSLAVSAGVPVVPGYSGEEQSVDRILSEAERIGYPVMLKASAGGGGKGMRVVAAPPDLPDALEGARREARSAFGNDHMFLEKLVIEPRHIEIQVFLDRHGGGVSLGERDCSIQRRHQKVVEEAPSPAMTPARRAAMSSDAMRVARAGGYVNAGTVEFLVDGDGYYFLEMNTRIQVEHPVTEMVTGLDLVRLQIEVAEGRRLPLTQNEVVLQGHAIEARLYAEDPSHDFLPATGTLRVFRPPDSAGVRNDLGVFEGSAVTPYYDPLLAKLAVRGDTREQAIERLQVALDEYEVAGPATNLEFLRWIAREPRFVAGDVDIGFIGRNWRPMSHDVLPFDVLAAASILQSMQIDPIPAPLSADRFSPWRAASGWRQLGLARRFEYWYEGAAYDGEIVRAGPFARNVSSAGRDETYEVIRVTLETIVLRAGSRILPYEFVREPNMVCLTRDGREYRVRNVPALLIGRSRAATFDDNSPAAPMPGTVVKVSVLPGQHVTAHEPLVILEAMKMEHVIASSHDAIVKAVLVKVGDLIAAGTPVVQLESPSASWATTA